MLILSCLAACASAALVVPGPVAYRTPSHDSAIIQSHRLGGNFAYSAHEAHAYGVQTPIVEQRVVPQGVSFHQGVPQVRTHTTVHKQVIPQFGIVNTQHTVPAVSLQHVVPQGVALRSAGSLVAGGHVLTSHASGPFIQGGNFVAV